MSIVSTKSILEKAQKQGYAVGAFNTSNLEITKAIINAATKLNSPVILGTTESAIKYASISQLSFMTRIEAHKSKKTKIALHLDHGKQLNTVKNAIKLNYNSVMIDASKQPYAKNIAITKKVVKLAHQHKRGVEAELGALGRIGQAKLTDPKQAKDFVKRTNIDALAVAIGTSHGAYKFKGTAKIDLNRLKEIRNQVKIPLVLHGASSVPEKTVKLANKYGAKLKQTKGVPIKDLKKAIKIGICKVNTDTDLRIAFLAGIRKYLNESPRKFDYRDYLGEGMNLVQKTVEDKIKVLGSGN